MLTRSSCRTGGRYWTDICIYMLQSIALSVSPESWSPTCVICTPLYTTCHANLKQGARQPLSTFWMPSRVALSPCMVIGRESPPGMPDCENLLGKDASQPVKHAHFPTAHSTAISETLRVVHTACTALQCASLLFFSPVRCTRGTCIYWSCIPCVKS